MLRGIFIALSFLFIVSCSSVYYDTMETFGYHKRDILSSRVESARDAQQEAGEQFQSALERFQEVLQFDGGNLEDRYNKLNSEYERSKKKADEVSDRIDSIEDVAEDLFDEWEDELESYTSTSLRRSSEKKLRATKSQYEALLAAMKRAESKIPPVLAAFHDQVLFLKHNLNASAISSLQQESVQIESDVQTLIREMNKAVTEANDFISSLEK